MSTTLRVSNLPPCFDSSMLEDMFTMIGNVQKAQVALDAVSGASRGYGIVEMSTAQEALDGIDHFNGQVKKGHALVVREDAPHVPKVGVVKTVKRRPAFQKAVRAVSRKIKAGSK